MNKTRILAASIAALLSTALIAGEVESTNPAPAAETAQQQTQADKDLLKVSDDAQLGVHDLHSARLAIFNGEPGRARTYVDAAVTRIDAAVKDADQYALDIKAPKIEDQYVPFDSNAAVIDTLVAKQGGSEEANEAKEEPHEAEHKTTLEQLRLGEVDLIVSARLVPVKFAQAQVKQAADLIGEGKYYEANLALKAVDDALIMQSFAVDATPKAADNGKADDTNSGVQAATPTEAHG